MGVCFAVTTAYSFLGARLRSKTIDPPRPRRLQIIPAHSQNEPRSQGVLQAPRAAPVSWNVDNLPRYKKQTVFVLDNTREAEYHTGFKIGLLAVLQPAARRANGSDGPNGTRRCHFIPGGTYHTAEGPWWTEADLTGARAIHRATGWSLLTCHAMITAEGYGNTVFAK